MYTLSKYDLKLLSSIIYVIGLIILRDIANVIIPPMITAVMCAIPLFLLPKRSFLSFVFFCIPVCFGIHGIFTIILVFTLYLRLGNKTLSQIAFPLIILLLELISLLYNDIYTIKYLEIVMYISYICVFFYILFYKLNSEEKYAAIKYFCIGLAFILFTVYLRIIVQSDFMELISNNLRSGAVMGGDELEDSGITNIALNANSIAYYSITLFSVLLLGRQNLRMSSCLYTILLVVSLSSGILTFSRTWFMLTIFIFILSYTKYSLTKKISLFLLVFVVLSLVLSTDNIVSEMLYDSFLGRFEEDNFATAGGRTDLFKEYNDFMAQNPRYWLAGTGVVHYKEICNCSNSMHNGIQQIYVCHGIIGVLIFLFVIIGFYRKYHKAKLIQFVPFIAVFIFDQSIQFLHPHFLMFPFICASCALKLELTTD